MSRSPSTHPEHGDRIRVRANLVACVVNVSEVSVQYRIETRGANAVVITRSAWEAMTRGCEVLGFDAIEVVR